MLNHEVVESKDGISTGGQKQYSTRVKQKARHLKQHAQSSMNDLARDASNGVQSVKADAHQAISDAHNAANELKLGMQAMSTSVQQQATVVQRQVNDKLLGARVAASDKLKEFSGEAAQARSVAISYDNVGQDFSSDALYEEMTDGEEPYEEMTDGQEEENKLLSPEAFIKSMNEFGPTFGLGDNPVPLPSKFKQLSASLFAKTAAAKVSAGEAIQNASEIARNMRVPSLATFSPNKGPTLVRDDQDDQLSLDVQHGPNDITTDFKPMPGEELVEADIDRSATVSL